MTYTDLFLDFDDTLYDTRGNAQIALGELFQHFQLNQYFRQPEDFYIPYWQTNTKLWEQYAAGQISRDYLIIERFRRPLSEGRSADGTPFCPTKDYCLQMSDVFLDFCSCKPGLIDGARELMDYLRSRHYRIHMCSNGFHEVQYKKLQSCGLLHYFDSIILSEDAGANKPSPQFFHYALLQTQAPIASTIMIGDNIVTDIRGAHNAGLHTLFFNPKNITTDFTPTFTVKTLAEIMEIL